MKTIKDLESASRLLDPNEGERSAILNKAIEYSNQFLNELIDKPGFSNSSFDRLSSLKIEEEAKPIDQLIHVFKTEVDVAGINSASGRHLGFIPGGGIWASALADYLSDITNKYAGISFSGPGAVKIESQVIKWMAGIVGYSSKAYGNLTSGGSIANLIAIKAARDFHKINSANVRKSVIYFGEQTHHSVAKAFNITGLHEAVLRKIPVTENFQIDIQFLEEQLAQDVASGLIPFLIIGSAGTTDTGAIDPLDELASISKKTNTWFHVDAAYGGFFMLLDEMKNKLKGIEQSDSVVLDAHKTLFLPFGSGTVLLKDGTVLLASNSSKASYLIDTEEADEINPSDTGIELTRPNRGMRIWLPLQLHGLAPFRAGLEEKLLLTDYFYKKIREAGFETGPHPDLTVTIFRHPEKESNEINQQLINALHQDGRVFLTSTIIKRKLWLRCAIVSHRTHIEEIDLTLQMINDNIRKIVSGN